MAGIGLEELTKVFADGTVAVSDMNLEIADGEFMVLVGPSGCGKTTALRMIAGLEPISSGVVRIGDKVVNDLSPKDRDVAMVFQNYALYPHLTVFDNMAFSLRLHKTDKGEIKRRVEDAARVLGLEGLLNRKPRNLSGGQRQRVAMGRAIVRSPQAFLMDEPLSNLDAKLRVQTRTEIARLQSELAVTTVYVTHDQVEAMTLGHRVAVMRKGLLQQVAPPQVLYERPLNLFVGGFIGSPAMNLVEAILVRDGRENFVGFGGHRLRLASDLLERHPGLVAFFDKPLILGIRPEDMADAGLAREVPTDQHMTVQVSLVEALGSDVLIHFEVDAPVVLTEDVKELAVDVGTEHLQRLEKQAEVGRSMFTASLDPKTKARKGERIELAADSARFHFFDPGTGLAIYDGT
jgi:multiple sugar transport system ATP-binding protein